MKIINKPWGSEMWIVDNNNNYALKIINIKKGKRLSLQYHTTKDECLYLEDGIANVVMDNKEFEIGPGAVLEIPPGTLHRIEAVIDCRFIEVSTPELEDVIRILDDYNRK